MHLFSWLSLVWRRDSACFVLCQSLVICWMNLLISVLSVWSCWSSSLSSLFYTFFVSYSPRSLLNCVQTCDRLLLNIWIKPSRRDDEVTGSCNCVITASSEPLHRYFSTGSPLMRVYCSCRFILAAGSESSSRFILSASKTKTRLRIRTHCAVWAQGLIKLNSNSVLSLNPTESFWRWCSFNCL